MLVTKTGLELPEACPAQDPLYPLIAGRSNVVGELPDQATISQIGEPVLLGEVTIAGTLGMMRKTTSSLVNIRSEVSIVKN